MRDWNGYSEDEKAMIVNKLVLWTHKEKGGTYEVLSSGSLGAGTMRGTKQVIYRDLNGGQVYHREVEDFERQMLAKS